MLIQHSTGNSANDLVISVYTVFLLNLVPVTVLFDFSENVSVELTVVIGDSDVVRRDFWGIQVDCEEVV